VLAGPAPTAWPAGHRRRLREIWRSAGWPCRDTVEIELLAAGLLARRQDDAGRETLRVTDAGIALLAATLERNRAAFNAHEALVARVALEMQRAGRVVWRGLSLRAPLPAHAAATDEPAQTAIGGEPTEPAAIRWVIAMPDVFSIRHTTVEDYVEPVVHEIKVRRADLLADLRRADKGAAYAALGSECWYVLAEGIARADEVPAQYGVMIASARQLEVARPAPRLPRRIAFNTWMALARAVPEPALHDDAQALLGEPPAH
jgi:hypothetical protein